MTYNTPASSQQGQFHVDRDFPTNVCSTKMERQFKSLRISSRETRLCDVSTAAQQGGPNSSGAESMSVAGKPFRELTQSGPNTVTNQYVCPNLSNFRLLVITSLSSQASCWSAPKTSLLGARMNPLHVAVKILMSSQLTQTTIILVLL